MHWLFAVALALDLGSVKSEPNLEKRAELAIEHAHGALTAAREAYNAGDDEKSEAALAEVGQSVELAWDSLVETGKDPRKSSRYKKAELRIRELLRRLEGMKSLVGFAHREQVERVEEQVSGIHDDLIRGIMSKRKKK